MNFIESAYQKLILQTPVSTIKVLATYLIENRNKHLMPNLNRGIADYRKPAYYTKEIINRVASAYIKAKADQPFCPPRYQVGKQWQLNLNAYCSKFDNLLREKSPKLVAMFNNLCREDFTAGLGGVTEYENIKLKPLYKYLYINTWLRHMENYTRATHKDIKVGAPYVGNPVGIYRNEKIVPLSYIRFNFNSNEILSLLDDVDKPVICEIGGGIGDQAYVTLAWCNKPVTYILFDLPEILASASYFLMEALPNKKFRLYGEAPQSSLDDFDVILLPNFMLPSLSNDSVDLFFNSWSFSEMNKETVEEYLSQIERVCKRYLLHINHNHRFSWNEDGKTITNLPCSEVVPDTKQFKRVYEHPWHFTSLADETYYKDAGYAAFLYERRQLSNQ